MLDLRLAYYYRVVKLSTIGKLANLLLCIMMINREENLNEYFIIGLVL